MEAGIDPAPAGDCRSLASGGIQVVLDLALAASDTRGKKMHQQGVVSPNRRNLSRGNLPPGTVGFLPGSMLFTEG